MKLAVLAVIVSIVSAAPQNLDDSLAAALDLGLAHVDRNGDGKLDKVKGETLYPKFSTQT